jgi:hypothetical protein
MGSFFSQKTKPQDPSLLVQPAAEEVAEAQSVKSKRDGRTYKEVLRGGVEKGSMSKLRERSAKWEFCETPENEEVRVQEHVPDASGDRKAENRVRSV